MNLLMSDSRGIMLQLAVSAFEHPENKVILDSFYTVAFVNLTILFLKQQKR